MMPRVDESWRAEALCAETADPDLFFFPSRGHSPEPAKAICRRCAVAAECLGFALSRDLDGVYGGTTRQQRRNLRRWGAVDAVVDVDSLPDDDVDLLDVAEGDDGDAEVAS